MDKIKIFIGVDQTGAVNHKGEPKNLNASLIDQRNKPIYLAGLKLLELSNSSIQQLLNENVPLIKDHKVLICVDAVFGLPQELQTKPQEIMKRAKKFSFNKKNYGAETAYNFFKQFLLSEDIPERQVEALVKANSVFNLKPYQKNIGCGSYRIIKDLAQDPTWFSLWPFDKLDKQFVIAEGYPSYFWRTEFNCPRRDLKYLSEKFKKINFANLDQADSFVLAYGASKSLVQLFNFKLTEKTRIEGWILGVPNV